MMICFGLMFWKQDLWDALLIFFLQILLKLGGSCYPDLVQLPRTKNVGAPVSCRVKDTVDGNQKSG